MDVYITTNNSSMVVDTNTINHVLNSVDRMCEQIKVELIDTDEMELDKLITSIISNDEFAKEYSQATGVKFDQYDAILGAWHPIRVRHSKNLIKRGIIENEDDLFDPSKNPNMIDHLNYLVKEFKNYWHKQMAV